MLYVAQDFRSSLATYSVTQAEQLVTASIEQLRAQINLPRLARINDRNAHASACARAQADSPNATTPSGGAFVLRYISMEPEKLPPASPKSSPGADCAPIRQEPVMRVRRDIQTELIGSLLVFY